MSTYVLLGRLDTRSCRHFADSYYQIHRAKAEKARERQLKEEMDAKRAKTKAARERKTERQEAKRNALLGDAEEEK